MVNNMKNDAAPSESWLTSTQLDAIGEALVASGLTLASCGRLAPFRPVADDNGHDLLVYDKLTRKCAPLQIKCRTRPDNGRAGALQFDMRVNTFTREGGGFVLCVLMERDHVHMCWLVPTSDLPDISRQPQEKLVIVASSKPTSRDRYTAYRRETLAEVALALVARLEA